MKLLDLPSEAIDVLYSSIMAAISGVVKVLIWGFTYFW